MQLDVPDNSALLRSNAQSRTAVADKVVEHFDVAAPFGESVDVDPEPMDPIDSIVSNLAVLSSVFAVDTLATIGSRKRRPVVNIVAIDIKSVAIEDRHAFLIVSLYGSRDFVVPDNEIANVLGKDPGTASEVR